MQCPLIFSTCFLLFYNSSAVCNLANGFMTRENQTIVWSLRTLSSLVIHDSSEAQGGRVVWPRHHTEVGVKSLPSFLSLNLLGQKLGRISSWRWAPAKQTIWPNGWYQQSRLPFPMGSCHISLASDEYLILWSRLALGCLELRDFLGCETSRAKTRAVPGKLGQIVTLGDI